MTDIPDLTGLLARKHDVIVRIIQDNSTGRSARSGAWVTKVKIEDPNDSDIEAEVTYFRTANGSHKAHISMYGYDNVIEEWEEFKYKVTAADPIWPMLRSFLAEIRMYTDEINVRQNEAYTRLQKVNPDIRINWEQNPADYIPDLKPEDDIIQSFADIAKTTKKK